MSRTWRPTLLGQRFQPASFPGGFGRRPGLAIREIYVGVLWGGCLWLFEAWCEGPPQGLHAQPECLVAAQFLAMTQKGQAWPSAEWQDRGYPLTRQFLDLPCLWWAGPGLTGVLVGSSSQERTFQKGLIRFRNRASRFDISVFFCSLMGKECCWRDNNGMPL